MPSELEAAVATLTQSLSRSPPLEEAVRSCWRTPSPSAGGLGSALAGAAAVLSRELPRLSQTSAGAATLRPLLAGPGAATVLSWCSASAWRPDVCIAPILALAAAQPGLGARVGAAAGDRVVAGPLVDALGCAPFFGDGDELGRPEHAQVRARLEILVWEAGATAREVAALGPWVWGSRSTFETMISRPAFGSLRGRVLAARCLEISAAGMPGGHESELLGPTLAALQPLLLHPEPLVWIHAARALGRLLGPVEALQGMLLDWVSGDAEVLRQRAVTALASVPAERMGFLAGQLRAIVTSPDEDAWVLAAAAAATPYLFYERNDIWTPLAKRILAGEGGPLTAGALARGLSALWRRGIHDDEITRPLRALRDMARFPPSSHPEDLRGWIEVIAITDVLDGAERDPLDLERGLDNLVRIAAQYDDEEADARAARFAVGLAPAIEETKRIVVHPSRSRDHAAAMNALVACTRAFALGLWAPLLTTHPSAARVKAPDLDATRAQILAMPAEILELVRERRRTGGAERNADVSLEILALTLGGYALDAGSEAADPERRDGSAAHLTCLWLRTLDGLSDGSRAFPPGLERALSELFWRLVDTTRGTTRGVEDDDEEWLGPFAAWWALEIDRPAVLLRLAHALPMVVESALQSCCERAEALRMVVSSGAVNPDWILEADAALRSLHAGPTELAHALLGLARALQAFGAAVGRRPGLDALSVALVLASDRLVRALADPVKALRLAGPQGELPDSLTRDAAPNAPRVASLVARAVSTRDPSVVEVWLASLGSVASALVDTAIRAAIQRTPPPPPKAKKPEPRVIEGYELVKPLGEGGVGTIWLVRKPGADRLFVLKIPKGEALEAASDFERQGILASFVEEAAALAGLYHPNVANIIDRGVSNDVPYLVLEYLIGADLKQYATARKMSLFELRKVVLDTCAGLSALHVAGLIHRDIKPGNLWLRLPLVGGEPFDPERHRDPALVPPLATVVIDFGMVRAAKVAPEVGGRFVAGTAGYIAPEQVLDPVELDPRADVYALAGTIYNVTTGRAFFDEIESYRDRIIAHMQRDPLEDESRLRSYPAEVAKLLRAATARDPADRPYPLEFARAFADAI